MRAELGITMVLLGLGYGTNLGCGTSKSRSMDYPEDSPHLAFVELQKSLRAGDADALWASYSAEMREHLAGKIRALLDRADDVVERDLGRTKAELSALGPADVYRVLINRPEVKAGLSTDLPRIDDVAGDPKSRVLVHYRESDGKKCTQAMDRVDGAWKVGARPNCATNESNPR